MKIFLVVAFILLMNWFLLVPWKKTLVKERLPISFKKEALLQFTPSEWGAFVSGLHLPLAAWLWLEVEECWEKKAWDEMASLLERILILQPHDIPSYNIAAWQMAWNASSAMEDQQQSRYYIERGRMMLEAGIENNPNNFLLYEYLGILLRDRLHDHEAAAKAFAQGAALPGAPSHLERLATSENRLIHRNSTAAGERLLYIVY